MAAVVQNYLGKDGYDVLRRALDFEAVGRGHERQKT